MNPDLITLFSWLVMNLAWPVAVGVLGFFAWDATNRLIESKGENIHKALELHTIQLAALESDQRRHYELIKGSAERATSQLDKNTAIHTRIDVLQEELRLQSTAWYNTQGTLAEKLTNQHGRIDKLDYEAKAEVHKLYERIATVHKDLAEFAGKTMKELERQAGKTTLLQSPLVAPSSAAQADGRAPF